LKKLLCIPFNFSSRGSQIVVYEPEELYDKSLIAQRSWVYAPSDRPQDSRTAA
jgi:hypothetical protein